MRTHEFTNVKSSRIRELAYAEIGCASQLLSAHGGGFGGGRECDRSGGRDLGGDRKRTLPAPAMSGAVRGYDVLGASPF